MESLILVFAKVPLLSKVKSRLAAALGKEKTLWIYKELLLKTERVLQQSSYRAVVFYTGGNTKDFGTCFQDFRKQPQQGNDLGERMRHAFEWSFAQGFTKIIGIGADLWDLDQATLDGAFHALDTAEAVLGPAKD